MRHQREELLENLGYDTTREGKDLFDDVVVEALEYMDDISSDDELYNTIHNKKSYIYVELACFYYEIGLNKFHKLLNDFQNNLSLEHINKDKYKEVFGNIENPDLFDSIFYISKYIKTKENVKNDQPKQYIKSKSVN